MDNRLEYSQDFQIDAHMFYDAIVSSTEDYIYIIDMVKDISLVSENMCRDFDLPGRLVPGLLSLWGTFVHEKDKRRFYESVDDLLQGRTDKHNVEYQIRNRKHEYIWIVCRGLLKRDDAGNPEMLAGVVTVISNKGKIDGATGLFRQEKCKKAIEALLDQDVDPSGILLLGLDDFKRINNLKNHIFGDLVLRQTAQNIQQMLPPGAEIFRFDGDEFAIVYPGAYLDDMQELYQRIHVYANREQKIDEISYFCSISGGIALLKKDGDNYLDLIKYAASALEVSKAKGKNRCTVFNPGLLKSRLRSMEMTARLHSNVMNGMKNFSLVYQPLVSADGLHLNGAEALLRWSCKSYGAVSPAEFVPLLESGGLICKVGSWIMDQAFDTCCRWLSYCPDFTMNINVSYLQVLEREFIPSVEKLLEKYRLSGKHIVFEFTESNFVTDMLALKDTFKCLSRMGILIAMDDFGTGYSSLGMLSQMPANIVKIDRFFISLINDQDHSFHRSFIGAVIQLCHSVGISVCVEGVESVNELETVCSLYADSIQGYYISKPISPKLFEEKFWINQEE